MECIRCARCFELAQGSINSVMEVVRSDLGFLKQLALKELLKGTHREGVGEN